MIKKVAPKPKPQQSDSVEKQIDAFAKQADGGNAEASSDPNAARDYKQIRVPFNKYEHEQLEALASKLKRSKLNTIRWALERLAEDEL